MYGAVATEEAPLTIESGDKNGGTIDSKDCNNDEVIVDDRRNRNKSAIALLLMIPASLIVIVAVISKSNLSVFDRNDNNQNQHQRNDNNNEDLLVEEGDKSLPTLGDPLIRFLFHDVDSFDCDHSGDWNCCPDTDYDKYKGEIVGCEYHATTRDGVVMYRSYYYDGYMPLSSEKHFAYDFMYGLNSDDNNVMADSRWTSLSLTPEKLTFSFRIWKITMKLGNKEEILTNVHFGASGNNFWIGNKECVRVAMSGLQCPTFLFGNGIPQPTQGNVGYTVRIR